MTRDWETSGPPPELLAAYADGALAGADHARIADWLVDHPQAQAEVTELRRLRDLVGRTQPAEPAPASWAAVLRGVHAGLTPPAPSLPPQRGRLVRVLSAAAAVLLLLGLVGVGWGLTASKEDANGRITELEARLRGVEARTHQAEQRAAVAERTATDACSRADEAVCRACQAEGRAAEAERRAEASARDMAATPQLELLSHEQVRLLNASTPIRLDDWATPMVVDPVLTGRAP